MANMFSYLEWRGDLDFNRSKFNEVDNLILCQLSYAPFEDIFYFEDSVSIEDACKKMRRKYPLKNREKLPNQQQRGLHVLEEAAKTPRFKGVTLHYLVCETDLNTESQFAAMTFNLPTDIIFIAFRGTDDSIVGWKEDVNLSFASHIMSQVDALNYVEDMANRFTGKKLLIGGHSKGGNLSAYAAIYCKDAIKDRIIRVYNNDGPGFKKEIIETDNYKAILPKLRTIVPESSIVGMLLEHEEEYTIVKSAETAAMQHDATSWEVLGRHFVYLDNVSLGSKALDETITAWLKDLTEDQMKDVVDGVYSLMTAARIYTISDFVKSPIKNIMTILKESKQLPPEIQKEIGNTLTLFMKEGSRSARRNIPQLFENDDE